MRKKRFRIWNAFDTHMERLFNGERIKCVQPVEEGFDQYEVHILPHNLNNFWTLSTQSFRSIRAVWRRCANVHAVWTLPESESASIFEVWRLPARFSLTSYSFSANFDLAQSVFLLAWCFLCLVSELRTGKMRKQFLFVHLDPMKLVPLGGAWFISKETMNIPSKRYSCNGVKGRRPQTHHRQWFLK